MGTLFSYLASRRGPAILLRAEPGGWKRSGGFMPAKPAVSTAFFAEWRNLPFFCYFGSLIGFGPKKKNRGFHTILAVKTRSEEKFRGFHTISAQFQL